MSRTRQIPEHLALEPVDIIQLHSSLSGFGLKNIATQPKLDGYTLPMAFRFAKAAWRHPTRLD
jgi:hypothetical protein